MRSLGQISVEAQVEQGTVLVLQAMGISLTEATKMVREMLEKAKEDARKEGTDKLPDNYGDILLQKEASDEKIKAALAWRRREGVTDQDIRNWWNQSEWERKMTRAIHDLVRGASFIALRKQGMSAEEAAWEVRKCHAMYGDPDDTRLVKGKDRELPIELKDRVTVYCEQWRSKPDEYKREHQRSSTFNAWIRDKLNLP